MELNNHRRRRRRHLPPSVCMCECTSDKSARPSTHLLLCSSFSFPPTRWHCVSVSGCLCVCAWFTGVSARRAHGCRSVSVSPFSTVDSNHVWKALQLRATLHSAARRPAGGRLFACGGGVGMFSSAREGCRCIEREAACWARVAQPPPPLVAAALGQSNGRRGALALLDSISGSWRAGSLPASLVVFRGICVRVYLCDDFPLLLGAAAPTTPPGGWQKK